MSHATSGSVQLLCSIIIKYLETHKDHLSKSEFARVATLVRDQGSADNLFRTKRAAIDYSASYPDPQCRIGEQVVLRAAGGPFNGTEVQGPYACWNPLSGRTTVEVGGRAVSGFFVRKSPADQQQASVDDQAA